MSIKQFIIEDNLPPKIALDTSFLLYTHYTYKNGNTSNERYNYYRNIIAKIFLEQILTVCEKILISSMVFPEFWRGVLINEIMAGERIQNTEGARKFLKNKPSCVEKYYGKVKSSADDLTNLIDLYKKKIKICESSRDVSIAAMSVMKKYNLDTYDAIHIGSMRLEKIRNFATFDSGIISGCGKDLNMWTFPLESQLQSICKSINRKPFS